VVKHQAYLEGDGKSYVEVDILCKFHCLFIFIYDG
jgi:hypothetical protein